MSGGSTAALRQYLAALETSPDQENPIGNDDGNYSTQSRQSSKKSLQNSNEDNCHNAQQQRQDMSSSANNDPLHVPEYELSSTKSMDERDAYSGHRVIAMPSSLGTSVRNMVSNKNSNVLPDGRPRSHSAGRAPQRASRDIVQDVYSRIGVNYSTPSNYRPTTPTRNSVPLRPTTPSSRPTTPSSRPTTPSRLGSRAVANEDVGSPTKGIDNFQQRYRSAAVLSNSTSESRPRSHSQGRRWPRVGTGTGMASQEPRSPTPSLPARPGQQTTGESTCTSTKAPVSNSTESLPAFPSLDRSQPFFPATQPHLPKGETPKINATSQDPSEATAMENVNDKEELLANGESLELPPPKSVKERLSVYSGSKPKRNFRSTVPSVYSGIMSAPPKINIYGEGHEASENRDKEDVSNTSTPPTPGAAPSPIASAAAGTAAELVRDKSTSQKRISPVYSGDQYQKRPSTGNRATTGGAFLGTGTAPLRKSSKKIAAPAPVKEVSSTEDASIMSALSGEFEESHHSPKGGQKSYLYKHMSSTAKGKPNKVASYQIGGQHHQQQHYHQVKNNIDTEVNTAAVIAGVYSPTSQDIEKLVQEQVNAQVNAQVKALEARMESQMLKMESRMRKELEQKCSQLEAKTDSKMTEILSILYTMHNSTDGSDSVSRGRDEI